MNFREHFMKIVEVKVEGKNIERIIKRIRKNDINILHLYKVRSDCIHIFIYSRDYPLLEEIKTVYKVEVIRVKGILYFIEWLKLNSILFISLLIGFFFLIFLSNVIFSVEVVHNDSSLRTLLINELDEYKVSKYHLKKSYSNINKIKKQILEKHKNRIEWLEIENVGTKYIIRVEERILNNIEENGSPRDIVAKKDAIIKRIDAYSGEVLKNKLDYVRRGDIIISGNIHLNEEVKNHVEAKGKVYGEVWYKVSVEYPLHYEEVTYTNKKSNVLSFHFFNNSFDLFNLSKYKTKKVVENKLITNSIFPIYLSFDNQRETKVINEDYTKEEAYNKAIQKIKDKINSGLSKDEHIIDIKKLKVEENQSTIILDAFVTVYEDITDTRAILEEIE